MTERPSMDMESMNRAIQELDTHGADTFHVIWWDSSRGAQPVVWPMRTQLPPFQGNLSGPGIDGMHAYSPREDH